MVKARLANRVELPLQGQTIEFLQPEAREDFDAGVQFAERAIERPELDLVGAFDPLQDPRSPSAPSSADPATRDTLPAQLYRTR